MTAPTPVVESDIDQSVDEDRPWQLIVWDDPVNTITFVIYVFRKLFSYSEAKATDLTMTVHNEGRAIVNDGPREKMEVDCYRLHSYGLWATIEQS